MHIYLNGTDRGTPSTIGAFALGVGTTGLRIGADQSTNRFRGHMDEVMVFNEALTASQVSDL